MSLTITHSWKCDLCGEAVDTEEQEVPYNWTAIYVGRMRNVNPLHLIIPKETKKLICPKHAITAKVNGDDVTLKGAQA